MDIIAKAREIGKELQKDERYIALQVAQQNSDDDKELQEAIGEFNLKRMSINNEAQKEERDEEKLKVLNDELRAVYATIMQNQNMAAYNAAKTELDSVVQRLQAIISLSAQGDDPETCEYEESSCGGSCSSCSGCH